MVWYEYIDGKRTGAFDTSWGITPESLHASLLELFGTYPEFDFTALSDTECVVSFDMGGGVGHVTHFKLEPLPRFGLKRVVHG